MLKEDTTVNDVEREAMETKGSTATCQDGTYGCCTFPTVWWPDCWKARHGGPRLSNFGMATNERSTRPSECPAASTGSIPRSPSTARPRRPRRKDSRFAICFVAEPIFRLRR